MGSTCGATKVAEDELIVLRRTVPDEHSCLFWAIAYGAEGAESSRAKAKELREVCAQEALKDPDPATKALLLGVDSVDEYATWIRNDLHWGGENEVLALSKHYRVEVAVVSCESLHVMCYGSDHPCCEGRVYVLYTGQHYDPLVAGFTKDVSTKEERRRFLKGGDPALEAQAVDLARAHNVEAARKAAQRRIKKIKCGGCGALVSDAAAFQDHCQEVEHGDDFAYDCEEVEVVVEGDQALPDGSIDLASDAVHTFTNRADEMLSNLHPGVVTIGGVEYATLEHYWLAAPFLGSEPALAAAIANSKTTDEAAILAHGAGVHAPRPDWAEVRQGLLLDAIRARAKQSHAFAKALGATGDKTIVCVDTDPWGGMQAPGGIATGQNHVGKVLMLVRGEL